jgi:hypothetical protein
MKDKKTNEPKQKPAASTEESVKTGKKAIETELKLRGKPGKPSRDNEKKDAEKWRNEG